VNVPQMVERQNLVTFDELDGYRVVRSLGYVSGSAVRQKNRLRATVRTIGALIGLAPGDYLSDAERLREGAIDALRKKADALGANAVIGLRFYASEGPDGATKVVAFGQAVRAVKLDAVR
jgi:uncharacterized protein YbjQ (UPF0145 family)